MARKNFGVKTYIYPQPVLIIGTYDENGTPDAMNAAWGGIIMGLMISSGGELIRYNPSNSRIEYSTNQGRSWFKRK